LEIKTYQNGLWQGLAERQTLKAFFFQKESLGKEKVAGYL